MASEGVRIGVVASDVLQVWQRDALAELRAAGVVVAARFAPRGPKRPVPLAEAAARLAREQAAAFALVPWDPPALADPASAVQRPTPDYPIGPGATAGLRGTASHLGHVTVSSEINPKGVPSDRPAQDRLPVLLGSRRNEVLRHL